MNRVSTSIACAFQSTVSRFTASRFTAPRLTASRATAFRSIASWSSTSKDSSNPDGSWLPCVSPNTLNYGFQVHLWVHSILASKCISKLAPSRPPTASQSSLHLSLQVHLQALSIMASKYIFKDRRQLYGDTGVTAVDRVMGSIYSADHGIDRHHLISISSYHTMKIHTLSFPTFGLNRSVRDFVDPQRQVVSYLRTRFLCSLNQNRSLSRILFGCRERCGGVLMECWLGIWPGGFPSVWCWRAQACGQWLAAPIGLACPHGEEECSARLLGIGLWLWQPAQSIPSLSFIYKSTVFLLFGSTDNWASSSFLFCFQLGGFSAF